ncbi:EAL domain-containing protein [Paenisporosarcina cavernae]|uniref:EAL domain-containing protein n=1 Tax=Paenisporosarcina cavernae TaxID=2320858 RepID=A0A385YRE5_9BACL|nr:EAL domain-containing protein [Paenisporosarcina cavernae]AYC28970.1 EAL domain-containing protein [Paenisporosarcina cavernae]
MSRWAFWNNLHIRGKVLFAMSIVVIPILLLMATYSYMHSKLLYEEKIEQELALENELVSQAIQSVLEQKGDIARQYAQLKQIEDFALKGYSRAEARGSLTYPAIDAALNQVQEENAVVENAWIAFIDGDYVIGDHHYFTGADYSLKNRPWLWKASASRGVAFSDSYTDYTAGQKMVTVTYPIEVDGRRYGYLGLDILQSSFPLMIQDYESKTKRHILLTSEKVPLFDSSSMWETFRGKVRPNADATLLKTENESYYVELRTVGSTGWLLATYANEDVVTAPANDFLTGIALTWFIAGVLILLILSFLLQRLLSDIPRIVRYVQRIEEGNYLLHMKVNRNDEVGEIARAVEHMSTQIHLQMEEMNYRAYHDSLTKLPNRIAVEQTMHEWMKQFDQANEIIVLTFMDIDHFKQINDSKGHSYGDRLLEQVAFRIREVLPEHAVFGRFGGDEFVILLRCQKDHYPQIRALLQEVHKSFKQSFEVEKHEVYVTPSMGVSLYPVDADTYEQLLSNADTALYRAKDAGRNRVYYFNYEMKEQFEKELLLEQGLQKALEKNELMLHFQPQFDLHSGKTTRIEALIRWNHPEWGMVSPDEFIPVAEKAGRIREIGYWVIDKALESIKGLSKEYPDLERVAINVSALQLRDKEFTRNVKKLLDKYRLSPGKLEMEVTESVFMDRVEESIKILTELKTLGVEIALDDFGTGFSSLSYLRVLPLHRVKIDRVFVSQIETDQKMLSLVGSIIEMAHGLGFETVAEGVETAAQLKLLSESNIDTVQGYYYSRPLAIGVLREFLSNEKTVK